MPSSPPPPPPPLLASQPQQVLAPLLLLFALGSASSARGATSAESSSRLDGLAISGSLGTTTTMQQQQQHQHQQQQQRDASAASAAQAHLTATSPNRVPFPLPDYAASSRQRHASPAQASYTPKTAIANLTSVHDINEYRRYKRNDAEEDPCVKFSVGDVIRHEFYSPGYPDPYPKNISCYKVLEAQPSNVLRVEFRDKFDLEEQDKCSYDFLEVRDGKYGYSRPIGNYCRPFPFPEITSSSRYLWLRFHSDEYIQGTGFRAVYSEIPRPTVKTPEPEECFLNVTNHAEYIIKTSEIDDKKKIAIEQGTELDCIWNITVKEGYKIQVSFLNFNLDKPNECDINYVQLYNKEPTMVHNPKLINNFCGSIAELVTSDGNEAYLRFFVTKAAINSSFEALMTATREKGKGKSCNDDEFDCQDVCIAASLTCNERFNCRYRFDEDAEICKKEASGLNLHSQHVIIILVVFTLLLSGLCFSCVYNCTKKLIRDHKIIKEHIRQSREKSLDELGRKSASLAEPCTEIDGGGGRMGHDDDGDADLVQIAHIHRSQRQQRRQHSGESANGSGGGGGGSGSGSREVASPVTTLGWQRNVIQHSVDLSDIHQSNNVSNASHERQLRESGFAEQQQQQQQRETRDMECQTRESIFDSSLILKPSAFNGPGFTTFGYSTPVGSRKQSLDYHPSHHYHHHAHPHYHPQQYTAHQQQQQQKQHYAHRQVADGSSPEHLSSSPGPTRRCSVCQPNLVATVEPPTPAALCPRHSNTPIVPAPHSWSAHESLYSAEELETLSRLLPQGGGGPASAPQRGSLARQRTVGSGEHYGFIYGSEGTSEQPSPTLPPPAAGSELGAPSSGSRSSKSSGASPPAKCPQLLADSRFKTEAVIEVEQKRPFSIESTKSAPDVIATH